MASDIRSLYEDLCARGVVSRNDSEIRAAIDRAEALTEMGSAIGRFARWLYQALATRATGWARAVAE